MKAPCCGYTVTHCATSNRYAVIINRNKKIERFAKNAHIEIPFEKKRTDTLVGPNETEKIGTVVLIIIIFSLYIELIVVNG